MKRKRGITRELIRRQARSGWVSQEVASTLMGFDLNVGKIYLLLNGPRASLSGKKDGRKVLVDLQTILDATGKSLNDLLDAYLPIDRKRRSTRKNERRILNDTELADFNARWHRLYRRVSQLIVNSKDSIEFSELKVILVLMKAARRFRRFDLVFKLKAIMDLCQLRSDTTLRTALGKLDERGLLQREPDEQDSWVFTLCDPNTKKPFREKVSEKMTVVESHKGSWIDIDD